MDFFGDQLVIIKDKASALKAMNIVVEQGEGNGVVDNSHYNVFTNLYHRKALDLHNMPENPKTSDYKETSPYIYAVSGCPVSPPPQSHSFAAALMRL